MIAIVKNIRCGDEIFIDRGQGLRKWLPVVGVFEHTDGSGATLVTTEDGRINRTTDNVLDWHVRHNRRDQFRLEFEKSNRYFPRNINPTKFIISLDSLFLDDVSTVTLDSHAKGETKVYDRVMGFLPLINLLLGRTDIVGYAVSYQPPEQFEAIGATSLSFAKQFSSLYVTDDPDVLSMMRLVEPNTNKW